MKISLGDGSEANAAGQAVGPCQALAKWSKSATLPNRWVWRFSGARLRCNSGAVVNTTDAARQSCCSARWMRSPGISGWA